MAQRFNKKAIKKMFPKNKSGVDFASTKGFPDELCSVKRKSIN
jgi:hypothetical protein